MAESGDDDIAESVRFRRRRETFSFWRDVALFIIATALLIYEAIGRPGEPRWALLVVYVSIFGLPLVLPGANGISGRTRTAERREGLADDDLVP